MSLAPPYTWADKKNWDKVTALDGLGDLRLLMSEVGGRRLQPADPVS